ncbi:hypothetical protein ABRY23_02675 [Melioribacteraceae bacterium 4301-Me]|uniref:hypothetical protein n=1 Tax=Pyranulibacter aquaticus TaxID=3163344 RepID=UPI00359BD368
MDNLLEYLIALFFIISLLSSLNKKKKQEHTEKNQYPTASEKAYDNRHENSYKIDFDKLLEKKLTIDKEKSITWDPSKEFEDKISEPEFHKEINEVDYDNLPSLERNEAIIENHFPSLKVDITGTKRDLQTAYEYSIFEKELAVRIREKLLDRNFIKDFFIITEILNKPMALRNRWQKNIY